MKLSLLLAALASPTVARDWSKVEPEWLRELDQENDEALDEAMRPHHRHRTALAAAHAGTIEDDSFQGVDELLTSPEQSSQDGAFSINPLVGHAIARMPHDLEDVKVAQETAERNQAKLGSATEEANSRMTEGAFLKRAIAAAAAKERSLELKLRKLEKEETHIERNKEKLKKSLTKAIQPKIAAALQRSRVWTERSGKVHKDFEHWSELNSQYKSDAQNKLTLRHEAAEQVKAADEALAEAQRAVRMSNQRYESAKEQATQSVERYRYVEARYESAESKVSEVDTEVAKEKKSLRKMEKVFETEGKRVELGSTRQREQLRQLEQRVAEKRSASEHELSALNKRFADWQEAEKERAAVIAHRKMAYEAAQAEYSEKRADMYNKAEQKVAERENRNAGWDDSDWAWEGETSEPNVNLDGN